MPRATTFTEFFCDRYVWIIHTAHLFPDLGDQARALAQELGIREPERLRAIHRAAELHDIGKIQIPDRVLLKCGPLDESEWRRMREHPEAGWALLEPHAALAGCEPIVRYHHERWDGSGYPRELVGEDIPLEARIFAVVDAFDAMLRPRPYRAVRTQAEALQELLRGSGSQFDPQVVAVFTRLREREKSVARRRARA